MSWELSAWLTRAAIITRKSATLLSVLAIALGVALGFAIHLINQTALDDFGRAMQSLRGEADATLVAQRPEDGVDLAWIDRLARTQGVAQVSPVIETTVRIESTGKRVTLYGIDVFSGALLATDLLPRTKSSTVGSDAVLSGGLFISPGLAQALGDRANTTLVRGDTVVAGTVAGDVPLAPAEKQLMVADIAWVQSVFGSADRVTEIRVRLNQNISRANWIARQQQDLPAGLMLRTAADEMQRVSNLSRAYRVNLNVLALVALLTGAFLVFATQLTAVAQRSQSFALLGVLGLTPARRMMQILLEALAIGVPGALLGLLLGYITALALINTVGTDLGGGYFSGNTVQPQLAIAPAAFFFAAGCVAALAGAFYPAWLNRSQPLAQALKTGFTGPALRHRYGRRALLAIVLLLTALALASLPAWWGLPVAGYAAIAVLLGAGVVVTPLVAQLVTGALGRLRLPAALRIAVQNAAQAPLMTQVAASGLMVSFALTVSMMLMVTSFRIAVDEWLEQVLPAPLYLRSTSGPVALSVWASLEKSQAFERIERTMRSPIMLDPARPAVDLLVREFDAENVAIDLPLTGPALPRPTNQPASISVWVSEAVQRLYGVAPGSTMLLPIGDRPVTVFVAGVWRDYARQFGAITMTAKDYRTLGHTFSPSDAALWPIDEKKAQDVITQVLSQGSFEKSSREAIRTISLKIFDRSFAVTYALEAAAILIGMFGLVVTLAANVELRQRELAMLAAMGFTPNALKQMVLSEGLAITAVGLLVGSFCGVAVGAVLVHVVNPQAFHWTMPMRMPWLILALAIALTFAASALASAFAARRVTRLPVANVLGQAQ